MILDPEVVKRSVDNLMRAPPPPLDDNNVRILKKTVIEARETRTTAATKRRVTQKGRKVPQLGEQAKQSLAPLKVFSNDIVDEYGMVRGTDAEWSILLVGYPKWKVDADNGKFPSVKIPRFVSSRSQEKDTQGGNVVRNCFLTKVLSWTCTEQITLLPTNTEEL